MGEMNISVILCSFNPNEAYLNRSLMSLKNQTLDRAKWELMVIDNNSKESLERRFDISWHKHGRHILETNQGLTPARIRGIQEARGELLVFVDDDNILDEDYLKRAWDISRAKPFIGAFGGNVLPEFEVEPKKELLKYTGKLAIREVNRDVYSNLYSHQTIPVGAGMILRASIARQYAKSVRGNERQGLDRVGDGLGSSGDLDMAFTAIDMGYASGLFSDLSLTHIIPKSRLSVNYLARLNKNITLSTMLLRFYRFGQKPKKINAHPLKQMLGPVYRLFKMNKIERVMDRAYRDATEEFNSIISQ